MLRIAIILFFSLSLASNATEPITPIPQSLPHDSAKAAIGKLLFFDPILSKDNRIACISCHNIYMGGSDNKPRSMGINKQLGTMNSPTVLNAVFNFTQFWNGRAKNLREQASGPVHNPIEMGMTTTLVEQRLNQNKQYRSAFKKILPNDRITFADVIEVIAEYEKTLITPNSKFDRFLRGEIRLSQKEAAGYQNFKRLGCASCHNGVNVGGNSFQKFGAIIPIFRSNVTDDRYALTKRERDKNVFKVPTLRNIALTAPYFHDGRALTLSEAVATMSYHNLGAPLEIEEANEIVAFLYTLSGPLRNNL